MSAAEQQLTTQSLLRCSDAELVQRIQQGEINVYEGIMRRYNQRLFRVTRSILRNDAEAMDVMQETYLKAFVQLKTLQDIKALPAWLSRIARNEALQTLRQNQRTVLMDSEQLEPVVELAAMIKVQDQPDSELANEQLRLLLERCIDKLPDAFRCVFVLRAIEQCSVRETATILELPEATVKTRYFRANALLQKQFSSHIQEAGLGLYEFAGHRCDAVVRYVLGQLA